MDQKYILDFIKRNFATISFIIALYFGILFTLPYFAHYGFLPKDISFFNTKVIFIIVFSSLIIYVILLSIIFIMALHFSYALKFKSRIKSNKYRIPLLILTIIIAFFWQESIFLLFIFVPAVIYLLDILFIDILSKNLQNTEKNINCLSYFFILFLVSLPLTLFLFFFSLLLLHDKNSYISFIVIFTFLLFLLYLLIYLFKFDKNNSVIFYLSLLLLAPLFILMYAPSNYINLLKNSYEKLGLRHAKASFFVEKDIYDFFQRENESEGRCENFRLLKIDDKSYCLLENVEIIWNGNKNIYVLTTKLFNGDRQKIISIPRSALPNGDIVIPYRKNK